MKDKLIQLWKGLSEADITGKYSNQISIKKDTRNKITVSLGEKIFEFVIVELPKNGVRTEAEPVSVIRLDEKYWYYIDSLKSAGLVVLKEGDLFLTEDNKLISNGFPFDCAYHYYDNGFNKNKAFWYNFPKGKKPTHEYVTLFPAKYVSEGYTIKFGNFVSAQLTHEEYNKLTEEITVIEGTEENEIINQLLELIK